MPTPNPSTTHSDRVAGWIVIGLFISGNVAMVLAVYAQAVQPSAQTTLLNIALGCFTGMTGAMNLRRPPAQPDTQQQVTIPSDTPGVAPITVSSGTPVAPVAPVVKQDGE